MAKKKSAKQLEIEIRRAKIARMLLEKITDQQVIATAVGCSQPTVSTDIAYLKQQWRANFEGFEDLQAMELAELQHMDGLAAERFRTTHDIAWLGERRSIKGMIHSIVGISGKPGGKSGATGFGGAEEGSDGDPRKVTRLIVEYTNDPSVD